MQQHYTDNLLEQEKHILQELEKWSLMKESILKQKSREKWITLGDANTKYFSAIMKERSHRKQILEITTMDGWKLTTPASIKKTINKEIMQNGPKLTHDQQLSLIAEVLEKEIYESLCAIHEDKALGVDGYNSCFFKTAWPIIKQEIVKAVQEFFITGRLYKAINCTSITPVPKVMVELGFPSRFQQWVLACVKTVSYSIIINGEPSEPFPAAKGLRQGDPMSPFLFAIAMECLS
ncbi:PREDICTED: uncharacterized protein LOC109233795 [Nicotiana attenuata]|uniref:uncharacterized protein LOC109233795 n=1 Tax=Nicotiana attenuata TaxID=49451 RepID=UPI0009057D5A|nr:PREDICTED: uncharacterized protein LOC109233795 [Nicotiana attenuata]